MLAVNWAAASLSHISLGLARPRETPLQVARRERERRRELTYLPATKEIKTSTRSERERAEPSCEKVFVVC